MISNLTYRQDGRTVQQTAKQLEESFTHEKVTISKWREAHNKLCPETDPMRKVLKLHDLSNGGKLETGNYRDKGDFLVDFIDFWEQPDQVPFEIKCKPTTSNESETHLFRLKKDCFPRYIDTKKPILVGINIYSGNPLATWLLAPDLQEIQRSLKPYPDPQFGWKLVYKIDIREFNYFSLLTLDHIDTYLDYLYKSVSQYKYAQRALARIGRI